MDAAPAATADTTPRDTSSAPDGADVTDADRLPRETVPSQDAATPPLDVADAEPEPEPVPCDIEPTIASLTTSYFGGSCSFSSCHSSVERAGGLDLSNPQIAYEQLVGVAAVAADGLVRVDPGSPESSFLVQKVEGPAPGHGGIMPPGIGEPLDPACRISRLRQWILDGALPPDDVGGSADSGAEEGG